MKKIIALILVFAFCISTVCYAMPFLDVDINTEEGEAVNKLWSLGYINGYDENTFAPQNKITRAEFVKIVNRVFSYTVSGENPFTDVKESDWYYNDICIAAQAGYINGMGDGRFCPEDNITREQALVIVNNILKMELLPFEIYISDRVSDWALDSVKKAVSNGLIALEEGSRLRATEDIKRGESALILSKCVVDKPDAIEPVDLESIADDVLAEKMTHIISTLKEKSLPLCYLQAQTDVINAIITSMESYLKDRSFDYKTAQKDTFKIYASMENRDDRLALQNMISSNLYLEDLLILYDFFFPEVDLNVN